MSHDVIPDPPKTTWGKVAPFTGRCCAVAACVGAVALWCYLFVRVGKHPHQFSSSSLLMWALAFHSWITLAALIVIHGYCVRYGWWFRCVAMACLAVPTLGTVVALWGANDGSAIIFGFFAALVLVATIFYSPHKLPDPYPWETPNP